MNSADLIPADQASHLLRAFLIARDENRPHFLADAFDREAVVETVTHTRAMSSLPRMEGIEAIAAAAVRRFGQTCENVYTFYLDKPDGRAVSNQFSCDWMAVMTEKSSGAVRVECGRYDWEFRHGGRWLVQRLRVTVAAVQLLPPRKFPGVLNWTRGLGYPWTTSDMALAHMPAEPELDSVREYLLAGR